MDIDIHTIQVQYASAEGYLASLDAVTAWRIAAADDRIVVGLMTRPMFSLSQKREFLDKVRADLIELGYVRAEVTTDADLYYRIASADGDRDEIEQLCDGIARRRGAS